MMKTSRGVIISCLLAVVVLSCESAYPELNSINDLKEIDFGQSVPRHILLLLHWFANILNFDYNNDIILPFNPNMDFGSHHYGNFERLLDPLPPRYRYYSVGNLNDNLPPYVRNPPVREYAGRNQDRIIFSAQEQNFGNYRIDRVYITQHNRSSTSYDPEHTYRISSNLLREIRLFSVQNPRSLWELRDQFHSSANDSQLRDLRNSWGNLACLGLLLFIVIRERHSNRFPINTPQNVSWSRRDTQPDSVLQSSLQSRNDATETCYYIIALLIIAVIILIVSTSR